MPDLLLILGNQLFAPAHLREVAKCPVFMAEDVGLCTHFKYHKHKLILFLASMRNHAAELARQGWTVDYQELSDATAGLSYEEKLGSAIRRHESTRLVCFEIEDKFFEKRITDFCRTQKLELWTLPSPMFLTSRSEFAQQLRMVSKPFMKPFYEWQRRRLSIMVDARGKPDGGQFSFDADNRKPLPPLITPPEPKWPKHPPTVAAVSKTIETLFADHPGNVDNFWLPTTRKAAVAWLKDFVEFRLSQFGPYEDALTTRSDFVFHSVISPLINLGLLTPDEIVQAATDHAKNHDVPISSLEGFIRQVIGWREFIRGIYQNYSATQEKRNFFKHQRKLTDHWYSGNTGIPPLDHAIRKVDRFGWCHHIERLMVISNLMLLCEVHPRESHRWFMEMFVDSSDWVMGPNVYGMGQFSDGGIFATKPYICGSNYYLKMSDTPRGEWCDILDGLFWSFLEKHRDFFSRNPRTMMMVKNLDRLSGDRKQMLFHRAAEFRKLVTRA